MAASVFITIRILRPKWSGPKVVILSGVYCIIFLFFSTILFKNVLIETSGLEIKFLGKARTLLTPLSIPKQGKTNMQHNA